MPLTLLLDLSASYLMPHNKHTQLLHHLYSPSPPAMINHEELRCIGSIQVQSKLIKSNGIGNMKLSSLPPERSSALISCSRREIETNAHETPVSPEGFLWNAARRRLLNPSRPVQRSALAPSPLSRRGRPHPRVPTRRRRDP